MRATKPQCCTKVALWFAQPPQAVLLECRWAAVFPTSSLKGYHTCSLDTGTESTWFHCLAAFFQHAEQLHPEMFALYDLMLSVFKKKSSIGILPRTRALRATTYLQMTMVAAWPSLCHVAHSCAAMVLQHVDNLLYPLMMAKVDSSIFSACPHHSCRGRWRDFEFNAVFWPSNLIVLSFHFQQMHRDHRCFY